MKLHQEFVIARPIDEVWSFFRDVPRVAACMPGAEYIGAKDDGRHAGKVSAKVGPFQASFEGEADVRYDEAAKSVALEGKGVDRKGASRGRMTMACALQESGVGTAIVVDSDVQLSGTIAQFGRTGLITEIANAMVAGFVTNAEAAIGARGTAQASEPNLAAGLSTPPAAGPISAIALLLPALRGLFKSLFRRTA
ncbi:MULTISPECIES: SRPBCC family protein [unclassified Bradyrhizobium]|uniref:CoxG family protein n=1 Tax=unclassified Bradyrhizobium TaxID=2631580 RepID=UPI001FFBB349|nr:MULTISPECIES: SRPBCC family protein [unclassified Bradyrhizobium]MCK1713410.1 SRPBCC family protein [Bradyrhizobium sp. 143]MCK1730455.1 SRPBCC family protein [Bradyrhizobium sp. 142]